jgi:alpha-tubulin suppressor-like RCC1 family protein
MKKILILFFIIIIKNVILWESISLGDTYSLILSSKNEVYAFGYNNFFDDPLTFALDSNKYSINISKINNLKNIEGISAGG